jgi:hypothetical protein
MRCLVLGRLVELLALHLLLSSGEVRIQLVAVPQRLGSLPEPVVALLEKLQQSSRALVVPL